MPSKDKVKGNKRPHSPIDLTLDSDAEQEVRVESSRPFKKPKIELLPADERKNIRQHIVGNQFSSSRIASTDVARQTSRASKIPHKGHSRDVERIEVSSEIIDVDLETRSFGADDSTDNAEESDAGVEPGAHVRLNQFAAKTKKPQNIKTGANKEKIAKGKKQAVKDDEMGPEGIKYTPLEKQASQWFLIQLV